MLVAGEYDPPAREDTATFGVVEKLYLQGYRYVSQTRGETAILRN